ncbi:MAG: protein phosphatase 2C domain-containing protein [Candidatus Niyogibacteria bacterium]|nr:MAG: protein phosphatase 2C domain-containing protein [Candidatus Niyogibacteria bacterium]
MTGFYTDHYFSMGQAHFIGGKPCQDYSLSGVCGEAAFAIVSDGCSTGGQTDVGARVIALSTAEAIKRHLTFDREPFDERAVEKVNLWQKAVISGARSMLGLEEKDMLATCLHACLAANGGYVNLQGDGVLAIKNRAGRVFMSKFEWSDNIPFYPAYAERGLGGFVAAHRGDLNSIRLTEEIYIWDQGNFTFGGVKNFTLSEGMRGITIFLDASDVENNALTALFSDGIAQIDGMDWKNAVIEFLAFKNLAGEFAKRRMIRGIKDARKRGRGPIDDIAYAVIRAENSDRQAQTWLDS